MGKTFSKPFSGKQPKSVASQEAKDLAAFYNQPTEEPAPNDKNTPPAVEAKGAAKNPPKPETQREVETASTLGEEPASSVSSSSSLPHTTGAVKVDTQQPAATTPLPDVKRVASTASSSYATTLSAAMPLDDYLKNTTVKPTPGLLFKDVLPFQPLTSGRLIHEEVDNLAQLATRLRDLRRTLAYDFAQLTAPSEPLAEAKEDKSTPVSARWLSHPAPAGEESDWALFRPEEAAEKQRLAESLSRLSCDERLEVLAMLDELRQQLQAYDAASASASSTTSGTVTPSLVGNAQHCYQAALLAHDRRQGWAKLVPPTSTTDPKENKETKEVKETKESQSSEARVIPSAFVKLREELASWLGVNQRLPLEALRTRLLAIQDYCQTAQRLSECSVHLQHEIQLARQVVSEFKTHAFKDDPELVQAICQLAVAQDPELLRALLGALIDSIKASPLLQVHLLQGLATVLTHSRAEDVGLGDLHTILNLLQPRTQGIGSDLSDADTLQLLQTLGAVLAQMALISQQRQLARQQVVAAHEAAKAAAPSVKEQLFSIPAVPLTTASGEETSVFERAKFLVKAKAETVKTLVNKSEDKLEKDSAAILSADAYDALCKGLHQAVVEGIQTRYGEDLRSKHPELYFAVILIRQALMRLAHKQASAKLLQKTIRFFSILDKAKSAVSGFSLISLLEAGNQMAELIGSTAWGKKLGDHFAGEEARPQSWFEQYLILKTLIGSDQLRELETTLVQAGREQSPLTLNFPMCIGALQLLDSVVRSENRPEVRKAAAQFLQLLATDSVWRWPSSEEFAAVQQRLKEKCDKDYATDGRLTLEQRRQQQSYQRAQQHSQVALRTARRHCQESDLRFQLHDYYVSQTRQAEQDAQWRQDNGRYIPALAKPRLDVTDDNAQLFFPQFEAFRQSSRAVESKDSKTSHSSVKAQSALLILGDAGTGKSLFLRRDHLMACARYISQQFDRSSDEATTLGSIAHPLSFHLYLNQSPVEKPLEHYLQQQGFTEEHIRQLKDQGQLLIHLDGYDEWSTQGQNPWVFAPKTLGPWVSSRCQVIVACRSQHIQGAKDYKDWFMPPRKDAAAPANARDAGALSEWIITCLDEGGVAQLTAYYVQDEQAQNHNPWSQQKYLKQFHDSGIQSLVRTPIILLMALQVLPVLQKRMADNAQILRLDIYREFITQYLETQRSKQLARGTQHLTGVIEAAESYAQALALALFSQEKAAVSYQPKARFSFAPQQDNPWHRFFADDAPDQLLSTIIPLRVNAQRNVQDGSTTTQYSFTHKSMLDYFTALGLYQAVEELANHLDEAPPAAPKLTLPTVDKSAMPLLQTAHAIPNLSLSLNFAVQWEAAQRYAKARHQWQSQHQQRLIANPLSRRAVSTERSVVEFIDEILQDHCRRWEEERPILTAQSLSANGVKEGKETEEIKINKPQLLTAVPVKADNQGKNSSTDTVEAVKEDEATTAEKIKARLEARRERKARQLQSATTGSSSSEAVAVKENKETTAIKVNKPLAVSTRPKPTTPTPREQFKARLTKIILASRDYPELAQAAGNAATLLAACHYVFAGEAWQGIRLKGANLVGSYWSHMNLRNAEFEDCDLSTSWWWNCDLHGVRFSRIRWGEFASVNGYGQVKAVAVNPADPNQLAVAGGIYILIYDRAQGALTHVIKGHGESEWHDGVTCLQYSPDGRQLATGGRDKIVRLWDPYAAEDQIPIMLQGHKGYDIERLQYAPDGSQLASVGDSRDKTVRLWDPRGGEKQTPIVLRGHEERITCLEYAPDSKQFATGSWDKTLRLWDPRGGEGQMPITLRHEGWVNCLQYAPDSRQLASGSSDNTVRLWNPNAGADQTPVILPHELGANCLQYAPDGGQLASGGSDNMIRLWDPNGGTDQRPTTLRGHEDYVTSLRYAPDGGQLASGGQDKTVRLWDPRGGEIQTPITLRGHDDSVDHLLYMPGGAQLASYAGNYYGVGGTSVRLWDPRGTANQKPTGLSGHGESVNCLQFAPNGRYLASGSKDKTVRLWDPDGVAQAPVILRGHTGIVTCIRYAPDSSQVAFCGGEYGKAVQLWELREGANPKPLVTLPCEENTVSDLQYAPDGLQLASSSYDYSNFAVRLWNPYGKGNQTPILLRGDERILCVQYAPDGRQLASTGLGRSIQLWNPRGETNQKPVTLKFRATVRCLQYAPDGKQLASGSDDNMVMLWDPDGGEKQTPIVLRGHQCGVTFLQYRPDGRQLASLSSSGGVAFNKAAMLWDPRGKEYQQPIILEGHTHETTCLQYSPDGEQLATGSQDKTLRVWDPRTGTCKQIITWLEPIKALCWGGIGSKLGLFIGDASGTVVAFVQSKQGFMLHWVASNRLAQLSFHGCKLSKAILPPNEQSLLEQRGGSFEEEAVPEDKAASQVLSQSPTDSTAGTSKVEVKESGQGQGISQTTVISTAAASTFFGQSSSSSTSTGADSIRDVGPSFVGAGHARDKVPVDAKAQHLLTELQATVDQLYPADKLEMALQRAAYLAKLQPYSSRETSLTQADRAGLRLLKGELEDVQEALATHIAAVTR